MALLTNYQSNSDSVVNHAVGSITTDAAAAAAITLSIGFIPRVFRWLNVTSSAAAQKNEYFEHMVSGDTLQTVAAGTMTLATGGIVVNTDGTVTIPAALIPASSAFAWEAIA